MQKGTTVHVQDGMVSTGVTYSFQAIDPVIGTDDISLVFYLSGDVLGDVAAAASGATEAAVAAAAASAAAAAASVDEVETLLDGYSVLSIGTVTTLPAEEDATVTNVGTPGNVILDFAIPTGEAGSPGAGTGDVVGPAAATNNGFVKFNGTTGKLLKDSAATISVADGGAGIPSYAAGDILYATSVTTLAKLPKGSALQALRMNAGATAPEWAGGGGGAPDAVMEDQKASGTNGGSFNSGSWITRTLNTEVRDPFGLISLASNQFTPTVDGWVEWKCPAQEVERHQSRLFNVT